MSARRSAEFAGAHGGEKHPDFGWLISLVRVSLLLLLLTPLLPLPARAQSSAYAELHAPDLSTFPTLSAWLNVFDAGGRFVSGLTPDAVTVLENGQPRPVQTLTEQPLGLQIAIGINPGPTLGMRDAQGITRYEKVQRVLGEWAQTRARSDLADDLSLVSIIGPLIAHTTPQAWLSTFTAFQPNFRATTPNIQSLAITLDVVLAATPQPGMKRAILFITPHLEDPGLEQALESIGQGAQQTHTRLFIWLVDGERYFTHPSALLLRNLAIQTGGDFFTFSGQETLPDPETYFAPLRRIYRLTYESGLNTSGDHTLATEITLPDGTRLTSDPIGIGLNVQPPNPILIALPDPIERRPPAEDPYNPERLLPEEYPVQVIFEFPDGHPRPIVRTVFYVDGEAVAENTRGALDQFTWDLRSYTSTGQHTLQVEATDSLGLTGRSLALPVNISVIKPPSGLVMWAARYRLIIAWSAVTLAGLALLFVLFGSLIRRARHRSTERRRRYADPLTQPVAATLEPPTIRRPSPRRPGAEVTSAPAQLVPLLSDGQPAPTAPLLLAETETTLGSDPVRAQVILDDPSVSPLHARLQRKNGDFWLFDQGSIAGTWVNYQPVSQEGYPLKHGDRVHFGRLMYRFELLPSPPTPDPKVLLLS